MCKVVTGQSTIYWYYIIFWTLSDVSLSSHIAAQGSQRSHERQLTFHTFIKLWALFVATTWHMVSLTSSYLCLQFRWAKINHKVCKRILKFAFYLYLCSIIMVLVTTKYAYCDSILQKPVLLLLLFTNVQP